MKLSEKIILKSHGLDEKSFKQDILKAAKDLELKSELGVRQMVDKVSKKLKINDTALISVLRSTITQLMQQGIL